MEREPPETAQTDTTRVTRHLAVVDWLQPPRHRDKNDTKTTKCLSSANVLPPPLVYEAGHSPRAIQLGPTEPGSSFGLRPLGCWVFPLTLTSLLANLLRTRLRTLTLRQGGWLPLVANNPPSSLRPEVL